ncbi:hypothetical protein L596_026042 [Steinernema carpocapsae]|uniref:Uncharacterized protein n=1 Tax=Steinernema carpocapsae TaxID=34508 RepID=A0A4U5M055_STECR|nr:hypothetical protein L596_026042 [Steinernema carpocapsae]
MYPPMSPLDVGMDLGLLTTIRSQTRRCLAVTGVTLLHEWITCQSVTPFSCSTLVAQPLFRRCSAPAPPPPSLPPSLCSSPSQRS